MEKTSLENIGNTPIHEYSGKVPNGNSIYIKRECDNPFGSHYDRVYRDLYLDAQERKVIKPGDTVLETTSGSAGVSFAGIGRELGYNCIVAIPKGGEKAREDAIREQGARLVYTPEAEYVSGFPVFVRQFLRENSDVHFLNHSMGRFNKELGEVENNEITLRALEEIAQESSREIGQIHYFLPAIGNGSSVLGPGGFFQMSNELTLGAYGNHFEATGNFGAQPITMQQIRSSLTQTIGFESFLSQAAFEKIYGKPYGDVEAPIAQRHRLPGTSFKGIEFPHIRNTIQNRIMDGVVLVTDEETVNQHPISSGLPRWDSIRYADLGRTGNAGIAVALHLINEHNIHGANFLVIGYDKADRYDS